MATAHAELPEPKDYETKSRRKNPLRTGSKKVSSGGRKMFTGHMATDLQITAIVDNPKRGASAVRYALYTEGMTVKELIAAGGKIGDVRWDFGHRYIKLKHAVTGEFVEIPETSTATEAEPTATDEDGED